MNLKIACIYNIYSYYYNKINIKGQNMKFISMRSKIINSLNCFIFVIEIDKKFCIFYDMIYLILNIFTYNFDI